MIYLPRASLQGMQPYEPGEDFLSRLQAYDPTLRAYKNHGTQSIVVFSERGGNKTHEFTVRREEGQCWPELERKIIANLPQMDVWKRFGSGEALDDFLHKQQEDAAKERKAAAKTERVERLKEDVDRLSFQHGLRPRNVAGHNTNQ